MEEIKEVSSIEGRMAYSFQLSFYTCRPIAAVVADSDSGSRQARRSGNPQGKALLVLNSAVNCGGGQLKGFFMYLYCKAQAQLRACVFAVVDGREGNAYGTG